jgi:hypothetical protein
LSKTLEEIDRMEASEVLLWKYYLAEPRGDRRADWHSATICHAIYTFMLGMSGDTKTKLNTRDLLLNFSEEEEMTEEKALAEMARNKAIAGMAFAPLKPKSDS